ncbi:hypothetical protein GALMADRAFT_283444 [Galerina marginata CBS 339.88]|uniref:EthD domain-containing protein n=1 Tax=Galerina marginata (strain CBS 339.88) TaxID=685588 RepID=A0A067SLP7_GALM3|nr:hypothetical protein GALMADRAFT_283444 [Galerina marginata CBS 339.88]
MPPGFLAVSSQPSTRLPLEEFHAWYEEEHIPLRLQSEDLRQAFLSGARYHAVDRDDEKDPSVLERWLAMYEIDDTRTFRDASYTSLREKRSVRETSVMARLEVLVRRTGEVVGVWGDGEDTGRTTGMRAGGPSGSVITHGLNIVGEGDQDAVMKEWAESAARRMQISEGWVRMRVVRVLESGKTRMGAPAPVSDEERMAYFVVHEFLDEESALKIAMDLTKISSVAEVKGSARVEVGGLRVWKLYKAYPCLAQGNVEL